MQLHHLEQLSNPNLCRQSRFHAVVWLTQLVAFYKNSMHNLVMERKSRLFFWHQIILNCQATCSPCPNTSHQLCKRCASTCSATIPPSRKATWGFVIAQLVAHQDRHVDSAYTFQSNGPLPPAPPTFHASSSTSEASNPHEATLAFLHLWLWKIWHHCDSNCFDTTTAFFVAAGTTKQKHNSLSYFDYFHTSPATHYLFNATAKDLQRKTATGRWGQIKPTQTCRHLFSFCSLLPPPSFLHQCEHSCQASTRLCFPMRHRNLHILHWLRDRELQAKLLNTQRTRKLTRAT